MKYYHNNNTAIFISHIVYVYIIEKNGEKRLVNEEVSMLETPEERVRLLKAGIAGKTIEEFYIICNNFKIVGNVMFPEIVEVDIEGNKNIVINQEVTIESSL
jgi:hypothetical protein